MFRAHGGSLLIIKVLGLCGGRRLPAGQLQLPQLRRRAPGQAGPQRPHPVLHRHQRRRLALGSCSTHRPTCASRSLPPPSLRPGPATRLREQPHQGRSSHQRRCRSRRRPAQPARRHPLRPLRLRAGARHPARQPRSSTCSTRPASTAVALPLDASTAPLGNELTVEAFAVPGKVALYLEQAAAGPTRHARGRHASASGSATAHRRRLPLHPGLRGG